MAIHLILSCQAMDEVEFIRVQNNRMNSINWDTPLLAPSHEQIVGLLELTLGE